MQEATADAYGESEQRVGFFTMIKEKNLHSLSSREFWMWKLRSSAST